MIYKCEKCDWEGKRTGSMSAAGMKIKICPKCIGISKVKGK